MLKLHAATLSFAFNSDRQATIEVPLRFFFLLCITRGMADWWRSYDGLLHSSGDGGF